MIVALCLLSSRLYIKCYTPTGILTFSPLSATLFSTVAFLPEPYQHRRRQSGKISDHPSPLSLSSLFHHSLLSLLSPLLSTPNPRSFPATVVPPVIILATAVLFPFREHFSPPPPRPFSFPSFFFLLACKMVRPFSPPPPLFFFLFFASFGVSPVVAVTGPLPPPFLVSWCFVCLSGITRWLLETSGKRAHKHKRPTKASVARGGGKLDVNAPSAVTSSCTPSQFLGSILES